MGYAVRMPQLGMTMEEGVVVEWPVEVGESVERGDIVAVVESEKTTNDVEAREDATMLAQFVEPNEPVGPGDVIAYVGAADEDVPESVLEEVERAGPSTPTPERAGAEPTARAQPAVVAAPEAKVSPRARSYAADHGVPPSSLETLTGTGPDGAVVEADVVEAVQRGAIEGTTAGAGPSTVSRPTGVSGAPAGRGIYEEREPTPIRRTIAQRMTASAREAPQVTLNRRVPVDDLLAVKARLAADLDVEASVTDFVLLAIAETVREHPAFNAIYEDGVLKLASNVNVGVAVDVEGGLLTPVVKGVDRRSLASVGAERSRLVERTLAGEHTHDDLADGTFTVTNLGPFGIESFDPLLNPPQVAILGIGAIQHGLDPETGDPAQVMVLSLTFDHRAVDGADAARFLDSMAEVLGHPLRLVADVGPGAAADETARAVGTVPDAPDEARTAHARSSGRLNATVRSRRFEWHVDEPTDVGGDDTAPNPVEQFLGSLASCLSLTIGSIADRRDVPVASIDVTARAAPEEGPIERVAVDVVVVTSADEPDVERVVQTAERACYVSRIIADDVERTLDLTVRPG